MANINPTYSPWGILGEWKLDSFTAPDLPCPENVAEFPAKVEALDPYSSSSRSSFTECTGVSLIEPNYGQTLDEIIASRATTIDPDVVKASITSLTNEIAELQKKVTTNEAEVTRFEELAAQIQEKNL